VRVELNTYVTVYANSAEEALADVQAEWDKKHGEGSFDNLDVSIVEVPK
jgi:hypothetical protein